MSATKSCAGRSIALRFEPQPPVGGLKPYVHIRRDLWAKVTRPVYYELADLGEERMVGWNAMVRRRIAGRVLSDGAGERTSRMRVKWS